MAKGSQFERDICKQLSLWWTHGEDDNIFWRTPGSGGRATARHKTGKNVKAAGDVSAVGIEGRELLKEVTIEIKRGYSKNTFADMVETSEHANAKASVFEQFVKQAQEQAGKMGTDFWWLISKRDRRRTIITMPSGLYDQLEDELYRAYPACTIETIEGDLFICPFDNFLSLISPEYFIRSVGMYR